MLALRYTGLGAVVCFTVMRAMHMIKRRKVCCHICNPIADSLPWEKNAAETAATVASLSSMVDVQAKGATFARELPAEWFGHTLPEERSVSSCVMHGSPLSDVWHCLP